MTDPFFTAFNKKDPCGSAFYIWIRREKRKPLKSSEGRRASILSCACPSGMVSNTTVAPNTGPLCPTKQAHFLFPKAYGSVQDLFNRAVASFCRRLELVYVEGVYGVTSSFWHFWRLLRWCRQVHTRYPWLVLKLDGWIMILQQHPRMVWWLSHTQITLLAQCLAAYVLCFFHWIETINEALKWAYHEQRPSVSYKAFMHGRASHGILAPNIVKEARCWIFE